MQVIVGTRVSTREGPDHPTTDDTDILDALDPGRVAQQMEITRDGDALGQYLGQRLAGLTGVADQPTTEATVAYLTHQLATDPDGRHEREFLFVRLLVHEIMTDVDLLRPKRRPELDRLLAGNHRSLFVTAYNKLRPASSTTAALIHALAFAQGRGLPRADRPWAVAAGALLDAAITEQDIDNALDAAAPYIMLDAENGQSVYRLAHQTFAEHFRADPRPKHSPGAC